MIWLGLLLTILFICFGGIVLVGAPYLPTLRPQIGVALELSGLKPGQTLLELGCGDGRVLVAAARQGYKAVGYELNPFLAALAWLRTRRYGGAVKVVWGDYWRAQWPPAEAVFTFLLGRFMTRLDGKMNEYPHKPVKLVSYAFAIPGKKPAARERGVLVYNYD